MDSNFHFGPARTGERTAYGARMPDASPTSVFEWTEFMRAQGITRVCCLLDAGQLAGFPVNLEAEYKRLFGATCVLMEPIADHHLCSRQALRGNILPFLRTADTVSERAVIHCWGGNGRTGHVLAAWPKNILRRLVLNNPLPRDEPPRADEAFSVCCKQ